MAFINLHHHRKFPKPMNTYYSHGRSSFLLPSDNSIITPAYTHGCIKKPHSWVIYFLIWWTFNTIFTCHHPRVLYKYADYTVKLLVSSGWKCERWKKIHSLFSASAGVWNAKLYEIFLVQLLKCTNGSMVASIYWWKLGWARIVLPARKNCLLNFNILAAARWSMPKFLLKHFSSISTTLQYDALGKQFFAKSKY